MDKVPTMGSGPLVRRRLDAAVAASGLGVFGLCALVADGHRVPGPEHAVFSWINGLPDGLTFAAHNLQFLGVLAVGPIVAVIALAAGGGGGGGGEIRGRRGNGRSPPG
jgi:hypothetical protein